MFLSPKYIQNTLNMFFSRQLGIRRNAAAIEDILADKYGPPLVLPIPDDQDPGLPRVVFSSKSGFSQIVISQISVALVVQYSEDFQLDISKGEKYIIERYPLLMDIVNFLKVQRLFTGFATQVNMPLQADDKEIVSFLSQRYSSHFDTSDLYDYQFRMTRIREAKYFSNIIITNYRSWPLEDISHLLTRIALDKVIERGIQIIADYNDRYIYNEQEGYTSTDEPALLVANGLKEMHQQIEYIRGE